VKEGRGLHSFLCLVYCPVTCFVSTPQPRDSLVLRRSLGCRWSEQLELEVWKNVWDRSRINKEAGMLWLIWHRSIAINAWCGRINGNIDQGCPVCANSTTEMVLHRFWECPFAKRA
jgi:hypothetical protein